MNPTSTSLTRRRFLRASGLSLALPMLPSLAGSARAAAETEAAAEATRLCYVYVPNGVNMKHWRPEGEGADFTFNRSTKSLEPFRDSMRFITGLEHREAYIHNDGAGDHARAHASFLTAARPHKTSGADIHVGVSADQLVAQQIGSQTRLPSLELSCDGVRTSGECDSGYSCAYQYNLAWADEQTPVAPESNPRLVFERLFGEGSHGERAANFARRQTKQESVIDFLRDEAEFLNRSLGSDDRRKVDEYLTGIREIETRIEKTERFGMPVDPDYATPAGIPDSYREHIRLMMDVMALALASNTTRVSTLMLAHDGSNRSFKEIEIGDGHHDLSHHKKDEERLEKIAKIDTFYCEQLAYLLATMKSHQFGNQTTLLDNTLLVYGSGLCDGDRHNHDDLPIIFAGGGAKGIKNGTHQRLAASTPMANLHLELINRMGVAKDEFGDSTSQFPLA
ncbi:DUF1552 domain-containing protein [Rubripirellula reticaptiva]|uniref:DUF1552 domain-containing protein n=1 Tax=Rubripirellula reticaptiva TaxID=2528013 RepID=A0A5C6EXH7_9BACT|nr:DUF1552 domain-containing protein [Rubripirellula reticaptiva]TWU51921.1 hypothetical protein Poly59_35170 [Rubripirellula reticaptiva]